MNRFSYKFLSIAAVLFMVSPLLGTNLYPEVESYISKRIAEFDQIPTQRKELLAKLAKYVEEQSQSGKQVKLTFICTHNSRRSHISQLWAAVAAKQYTFDNVETYSGGTEATAFNPRAVAAMVRAGFKIDKEAEDKNPRYHVQYGEKTVPFVCFSKKYDSETNPAGDYCAVMVCSEADKGCPVVNGAQLRLAISFEDPKVADGTDEEAARYDERCAQIAREMLYTFSLVKSK